MANDLTTIQISKEASDKLRELAETYKRSKAAQAEWLIEQEYRKLEPWKLVGPESEAGKSKKMTLKG